MLLAVATAATAGGAGPDVWMSYAVENGPGYVLALIVGYGWKRERERADSERARADAERKSRDDLAAQFMDRVIPALERSTAAQQAFIDASRQR